MSNRKTVKEGYSLTQLYQFYLEDNPKGSKYYTTIKQFKTILIEYHNQIIETVLQGEEFIFPYGLGSLNIFKKLPKSYEEYKLKKNFSLSKKYDKPIYFLNEHSEGYYAYFKWIKKYNWFNFSFSFWKFKPVRQVKKRLADEMRILNGHNKYKEKL